MIGVLIALWWLLASAPAASAHAYLLASTPPSGYAVPTAPTVLSLDFDLPVTIGADPLELTDTGGAGHPVGPSTLTLGGRRLSAPVPATLPDRSYRLRWQVIADDGDVVSGSVTFTVGAGAAESAAAASGAELESPVVIAGRWMVFTGLALALGGLVGDRLARRVLREANRAQAPRPPPLMLGGAALGATAAVVLALDQVGTDLTRLVATGPGRVLAVETAAFTTAALLAYLGRRRRGGWLRPAAGVALMVVVAAEGLRAHPHANSPVWGAALTIVHLLAAAVWIGALVHVLRTARHWRDQPAQTRLLVYDYARLALILVAAVVATGTAEAIIVLPTPGSLLTTAYGLVLMAKLALVAVTLVLATLSRRRLRASVRTLAVGPLGRTIRPEAAALVGVLAVTAVLVSIAPAGPSDTDLAAPPLPVGPVVPAGTLAGQVTVIATATTGQLVIRMTTPGRDDLGTDSPSIDTGTAADRNPPSYQVKAQVSTPVTAPAPLTLRGCGPGCFTTPIQWQPGPNQLHLTIAAPPWSGGTATLDLPWPPRAADPTLLPAVLAAMRAVPQMTVHQSVTSDYNGYPGAETPLPFSGAAFLATEPYSTGGGNPVILLSRPEETEIGLSYPNGIAIRLSIDDDHRILREQATTPNHLITSTFQYPPDDHR